MMMMMEILKELLLSAVVSVLFALFLARLVSFAADTRSAGDDAAVAEKVSVVEKNGDDGKVVVVEEIEGGERESEELAVEKPVEKEELEEGGDGCEEEGSVEVKDGNLVMEDGNLETRKLEEEEEGCFDVEDEEIGVKGGCVEEDLAEMELGGHGGGGGDEEEIGGEVGFRGAKDGREGLLSEGEDDDWEGIEKSELEERFGSVSKFVASGAGDALLAKVGSDVLIQLYGLHKMATEGPCYGPPPLVLKSSARAKWNAWKRLGNLNQETAMEQYITLLNRSIPGWKEKRLGEDNMREDDPQVAFKINATDLKSSTAIQLASDAERKPGIHTSAEGDDGGSPAGRLILNKQDSQ